MSEYHNHQCSIGTLIIRATSLNHLYVTGTVVVRKVDWNIQFHAERVNGQLVVIRRINGTRQNSFENLTLAAEARIREVVIPAINEWSSNNPQIMAEAQLEEDSEGINNRTEQIMAHEKAIKTLRNEAARIKDGEHLGPYSKINDYEYKTKPE